MKKKKNFQKCKKSLFYDIVLTRSRERRAMGTNASRVFLVSLKSIYDQKIKPKA
jgi:hypothetical protein